MRKLLLFLVVLTLVLTTVAWLRYGGGAPYPDMSTPPALTSSAIEEVLDYPEPIGGVAVSSDGRLFFTVHPDSRSPGNRLLEYVDGASVPYPNVESQHELFDTVLGIAVDPFDRLWTVDHGNHGFRGARVVAIDLATGKVLRDQRLGSDLAPLGSYLRDIDISADGRTAVIADASVWRKRPAVIVYDIETGRARRVLEGHPSVSTEPLLIRSHGREMSFVGGVFSLRSGVAGLAFEGQWLYYGAMTGSGLYRVRAADLLDQSLSPAELGSRIERHASKPLSSGLSADAAGGVFVTDVERGAVHRINAAGELQTIAQSEAIRWPEDVTSDTDGWLYIADSALPELVLTSRDHVASRGPYRIFRIAPAATGAAALTPSIEQP